MSDNILGLSSAGLGGPLSAVDDGSHKFASYGERYANAVWLLVPLALAGLVVAAVRRRPSIFHLAFLIALPLVVAELADTGVSWNHLIDIEVLTAIVVASFCGSTTRRNRPFVRTIVLVSLIWGIATAFQLQQRHDLADAARGVAGRSARSSSQPLRDQLARSEPFLSEDPSVPVLLDRDPVVLDPFMLLRILRDHDDWRDELLQKIKRRRFAAIVLQRRLNPGDRWWRDYHFGPDFARVVAANYRLSEHLDHYFVYRPKRR
jgi:hypothetical protein